jgi:hypothetical protein
MSSESSIPRDKLLHLLDQLDAFDAIAAMLFAMYAGCPSSARAQPIVASGVAAEYIVMHLLRRGTVAPKVMPSPEPVLVEKLAIWAQAGVNAESLRFGAQHNDNDPTGMETDPRRRFAVQQLVIYDPVVPELEAQRWPQLFAPVETALERVTGLNINAIQRITESLLLRAMGWCLTHADVSPSDLDGTNYFSRLKLAVMEGRGREVQPGSSELLTTTSKELALGARVLPEQVDRFLDLFATRPTDAAAHAPFTRFVWDLRRRPLLAWDDRIILPVPLDLTTALRPTLETALRSGDPQAGARYDQHKGKWFEHQALGQLTELLTPDQAYRAVDEMAEPGRTNPEHDGLLRVERVAFAVEAKGGGVAPAARRGNADSQDKVFRRLVHEGIAQADGIITALQTNVPVTGIDLATEQRVPIDLGKIERWIPLVVTLEDMSGAVAAYRALFSGRDRDKPHPIVLTLDDLVWISNELALPAQFVHYLIVRERIARSSARLVMHDEVEWFGLYYAGGGAWTQKLLNDLENAAVPVLIGGGGGRRGALNPDLVPWETPFVSALERWQSQATDGWLAASMAMLDLSTEQGWGLASAIAPIRRRAIEANDVGLFTMIPEGNPSVALQLLVPGHGDGVFLTDYEALFVDDAPDVDHHIFLLAEEDDPGELQLVGIAPTQKHPPKGTSAVPPPQ